MVYEQYDLVFQNDMTLAKARKILIKDGVSTNFDYSQGLYYPLTTNVPIGKEDEYVILLEKKKGIKRAYRPSFSIDSNKSLPFQ